MKYFILLVVIAGVIWWLRTKRNNSDKTQDASRQSQNPQTMVRCAHCDLHLPQSDAVEGSLGVYCSASHRLAKEG
ncbi:MAG: hypothetical protein RL763_280 [Pseudomonadota bacterium]|jgi:uncharacterized protein